MLKIMKTPKELRKFAFIIAGYFIAFNVFLFYGFDIAILSVNGWVLFTALFLFSLGMPQILLPVSFLYIGILTCLNWLNVRLLLGFVFFLLFTPISLFRRLRRKDTLEINYSPKQVSYRQPIVDTEKNDIRRPY